MTLSNSATVRPSLGTKCPPQSAWAKSFPVDFLGVFCIFVIYAASAVPAINEPHYWTKAAHFWNPSFGANDLFLESGDAHWFFFATFGYLTQCLPLVWAVWTGRLLTWIFLALGWTMLGRSLWRTPDRTGSSSRFDSLPMFASCWALTWLVGLHYGHWAGEWVVGGCESKGIAYALIFAGLAMAIRRNWTLAWTFLGLAAAYHVVTGIWVILCVATVSWLLERRESHGVRHWLTKHWLAKHRIGWLLCSVGIVIGAVPALAIDWGTDPQLASESAVKQVYTRLGHHLAPSRFSAIRWQSFGIQVLCGTIVCLTLFRSRWVDSGEKQITSGPKNRENDDQPKASHWFAFFATLPNGMQCMLGWGLFAFAVAIFGLLVDWMFGKSFPEWTSKLLRFYLFRWNDVAMPMTIGALTVAFAFGKLRFESSPWLARSTACGCVVIPGSILLFERLDTNFRESIPAGDKAHFVSKKDSSEEQQSQFRDWLRVCEWIRAHTDPKGLWLTPRRQQSFKWHTGRPELACWKDAPQNAQAVVEWSQRLADAYQFSKGAKILQPWSTEKLLELHTKYDVRYVLLDLRVAGQKPPLLQILYPPQNEINENFAVFEFTSQPTHTSTQSLE